MGLSCTGDCRPGEGPGRACVLSRCSILRRQEEGSTVCHRTRPPTRTHPRHASTPISDFKPPELGGMNFCFQAPQSIVFLWRSLNK